jgi:GNAT superfamily N-acetyltransferase
MRPTAFRELGPADVDALQGLLESVPDYAERITGYPPGPSDGLSALISVPDGFDPAGKHGWGLWDGSVLVAFADVLIGYPVPTTAFVGLLLVRGDRHGTGLGRAMHDVVVERLRTTAPAVRRLRLGIVRTNAAVAEPFWRRLGYAPTGEEKPYRYDHLSSTVALWERSL